MIETSNVLNGQYFLMDREQSYLKGRVHYQKPHLSFVPKLSEFLT